MESAAPLSVASLFALILDGLLRAIAARVNDYPINAAMVSYLWKRVNRVKNRFLALAALVQAGKIPRERAAKPRARKGSGGGVGSDGINWKKWLPMSRFAWLCWLMPSLANRFGAAQFGDQLRHLLGRAEMRAILAATPKAGRLLAPLCFMLGIDAALLRPVVPAVAVPELAADGDAGCAVAGGTAAIGSTVGTAFLPTVPACDGERAASGVDGVWGRENFSRG
jgi:hypothetical protein